MLGVAVAGVLAHIMQVTMNMSGLSDQHSVTLSYTFGYDMKGIIFAAVIIGALGAVMDVAISIASSLEEIIIHTKEEIAVRQIIKSGMKIGADIMGTMTNTLVLCICGKLTACNNTLIFKFCSVCIRYKLGNDKRGIS